MTAIPLKRIEGCLVANREVHETKQYVNGYGGGFQDAMDQQGEVKIRLNPEKAANELFKKGVYVEIYGTWENLPDGHQRVYLEMIDTLNSALPELVEVVK